MTSSPPLESPADVEPAPVVEGSAPVLGPSMPEPVEVSSSEVPASAHATNASASKNAEKRMGWSIVAGSSEWCQPISTGRYPRHPDGGDVHGLMMDVPL